MDRTVGRGGETGSKALTSQHRLAVPTAKRVDLGDSYSCHSGRNNPYPRGARGLSRLIGMGYQAWERHRPPLVHSLQAWSGQCWRRQETPLNGGQIPVNKTVSSAAGGTCKRGLHNLGLRRFGLSRPISASACIAELIESLARHARLQ